MSVTFYCDGMPDSWGVNISQQKYVAMVQGSDINTINRDHKAILSVGRCTPVEFFRLLWNMPILLKHELGDRYNELLHLAQTGIAQDALFIRWC